MPYEAHAFTSQTFTDCIAERPDDRTLAVKLTVETSINDTPNGGRRESVDGIMA